MRHQYTPIFKDVLTSRVWALPDAHLRVWLWLQLQADPEGFICADVTGVAVGARVSGQDAREALEVLSLVDADAEPSDVNLGRLVTRVPKGWRVVGYEEKRDLAKREAQNARNRRYAKRQREPANDTELTPADAGERLVDSSKSKSKSKSLLSEEETTSSRVVPPRIINKIPDDWQPSEELRQEAVMAGVLRFDEQLATLRVGPIGGNRGVFEDGIDHYLRSLFGIWRTWEETQRAKASAAAKPRGQSYRQPTVTIEPTAKHRAYAAKHGLPLDELVAELVASGAVDDLGAKRALEMLGEKMGRKVREQCDRLIAKQGGEAA